MAEKAPARRRHRLQRCKRNLSTAVHEANMAAVVPSPEEAKNSTSKSFFNVLN